MKAGAEIAGILNYGDVLVIQGALGAGKTCLVKGIARFFSIEEEITSPTYTIVSEYEGKKDGKPLQFFHIDAYRLKGEDDFSSMGGEEYLYGSGISVVEWGERISGLIPPDSLIVNIEITGENSRIINIKTGIKPRETDNIQRK